MAQDSIHGSRENGCDVFQPVLLFEDLGYVIEYHGQTNIEPVYRICPSFELEGGFWNIRLFLHSSDATTPLEDLIGFKDEDMAYVKTIEQAANIDIDDFANLLEEEPMGCFETPYDI